MWREIYRTPSLEANVSLCAGLHPHRHQDVERTGSALVLDQGRRTRIGELQDRSVALDLAGNVEQIARVETDIDRIGLVAHLKLLGGAAGVRVDHRQDHLA